MESCLLAKRMKRRIFVAKWSHKRWKWKLPDPTMANEPKRRNEKEGKRSSVFKLGFLAFTWLSSRLKLHESKWNDIVHSFSMVLTQHKIFWCFPRLIAMGNSNLEFFHNPKLWETPKTNKLNYLILSTSSHNFPSQLQKTLWDKNDLFLC